MALPPLRCPRCGFRPLNPAGVPYRAGSACPQCSGPLSADGAAGARPASVRGPGRPREGTRPRRPERSTQGAKRGGLFKAIVFGAVVTFLFLRYVPPAERARLVREVRSAIESLRRGHGRADPSRDPEAWGRPNGFSELRGEWVGPAEGMEGEWTFRFALPNRVEMIEPDGTRWRGEGRVYWGRADEGGLRVLAGGQPLDVAFAPTDGRTPRGPALGSWRVGGDTLQLCLGRPGDLLRTSEFGVQPGITCWSLERAQR